MRTAARLLALALAATGARAEEPSEAMARGKLASDLGRHAEAAAVFRSVAESEEASPSERGEARVRLGASLREAGDPAGSSRAFQQAWESRAPDPEDVRFLIEALGSPVPGGERWQQVWSQVDVEFGKGGGPAPRVVWPGVPAQPCPRTGHTISLDFEDGDLQDVFRLFADITGFNVVVNPGTFGLVSVQFEKRPWDQALCEILAPHGFVAQRVGNVLWIGKPDDASPRTKFSGKPIDIDFRDLDLIEALSRIAAEGGASVQAAAGIGGRVTLRLVELPWDQAFDVLANVNGLTWSREGDVIEIARR